MTEIALFDLHHDYSRGLADAGPLTFGVVSLIAVALFVVLLTYLRARRTTRDGHPRPQPPRRGTSAVLLGAIAAVLLFLTSASQHRIASLTIVSGARKGQAATRTARQRPDPGRRGSALPDSYSLTSSNALVSGRHCQMSDIRGGGRTRPDFRR
jgi:hypothetical protein